MIRRFASLSLILFLGRVAYCYPAFHLTVLATNQITPQTSTALKERLNNLRSSITSKKHLILLLHAGSIPTSPKFLADNGYDAITLRSLPNPKIALKTKNLKLPILCANIQGSPIQPYFIKKAKGLRIGIIGISPVQWLKALIKRSSMAYSVLDPIEAFRSYESLIDSKVDFTIALSDLGAFPPPHTIPVDRPTDETIALKAQTTKVIVGTQSPYSWDSPLFISHKVLFQAGKGLSQLDLFLDKTKKVTSYTFKHYTLSPTL